MTKTVSRLFDQFHPSHYQLSIHPDKQKLTFTGTVTIQGRKIGRPSQRIVLHQKELKVTKATITKTDKKGSREVVVDRINAHKAFDEVRLHTTELLYPGDYTVTLSFSGKITKLMNGLYPCYFEQDGKQQTLLATQFESHHAREVFPCIDEPEAKATFDLTITALKDDVVLSNTPIRSQETDKKYTTTTFETTPIMSTYLLAFIIGDLTYKEGKTKEGVTVRTYATPEHTPHTSFALEVAIKCLDFYNDYFGIDYPLEKCDLIALPDFASGAMENWGCITFREQTMLVDPKNTSLPTKQYVAMVVAHELAHQWFGNLVTMKWWTDLWLNEGFASWIEYLAIDHLYPEWDMWTQFISDEQQIALKLDSLNNTHPIEVPVNHPDEIRTIFDTISYNKGASVIHMLHEYLGPKAFRNGLRYYLEAHQYSNTVTTDLWDALEEASEKPVKKFMHAWTSQPGFPLLRATVTDSQISVEQERYYANPSERKDKKATWPIPLRAPGKIDNQVLSTKDKKWPGHHDTTHFKFNSGQSAFYRTVYNATHLQHLGEGIRQGRFAPLDRLGILTDTIEAAKSGYSDTADALVLLSNYRNEDNAAVWDVLSGAIASIRAVMDDEELREDMKPYVRNLVQKQLDRLGWKTKPNESHFDSLLRPTVLGMASISDDEAVVKEALRRFQAMKKPEDIEPDLRSVVYHAAVRHGDEKTFDKLLRMHNETTLSEERNTIAAALTNFKQPALVKKSLALIMTDTVRLQDVAYWLSYSFMNRYAKHETWKWMQKHWKWLSDNLGTDMSFHRFPMFAARSFSDEAFITEYKAFFEPLLSVGLERAYKQGIEVIQWQSAWRKRDLKTIKHFFATQQN